MAEAIKFTEEELQKIKSFQDSYNNFILQLGQLEIELINLQKIKENLTTNFIKLKEESDGFSKTISDKYGDGVLNPATGEFVPSKEPQGN